MNNLHANPVEITKKDIYVIFNDINDKVYIGQSKNCEERFRSHCKPSQNKCIIDRAINKYGKNHFWYEVLEENIEDYNEREIYWIQQYNSLVPNGYNVTIGGSEAPVLRGDDHGGTKLSDEDCALLKEDLKNTKLPLSTLAKKYRISKRQVLRINQGLSRVCENEEYPIRKTPNMNGKLCQNDVDEIMYLLQYTYLFNGEIARRYNVKPGTIHYINIGKYHRKEGIEYPIRLWKSSGVKPPVTYDQVTEIIDLIQNTTLSLRKIAGKYGIDVKVVQHIKNGTAKYRRRGLQYPLRPR